MSETICGRGSRREPGGRAWVYGDEVDTDAIIPATYLATTDRDRLARHCMEGIDRRFAGSVRPGDVIVAGRNFGCGSSREHAPLAIMAAGVSAVVARSFARIFFRNSINLGLPVLVADAAGGISDGDRVEVDAASGAIRNLTTRREFTAEALAPAVREILDAGGLIQHGRARLARETGA